MGFEIVTGYTGEAHVYSSDVRALNRNLVGNGNYVLMQIPLDFMKATC